MNNVESESQCDCGNLRLDVLCVTDLTRRATMEGSLSSQLVARVTQEKRINSFSKANQNL